jgi:hypothetical protein
VDAAVLGTPRVACFTAKAVPCCPSMLQPRVLQTLRTVQQVAPLLHNQVLPARQLPACIGTCRPCCTGRVLDRAPDLRLSRVREVVHSAIRVRRTAMPIATTWPDSTVCAGTVDSGPLNRASKSPRSR